MKKILIPLALIIGFLLTGSIITLLVFGNNSGGQGVSSVPRGENGEVDMPEIVFVKFFYYPLERKYESGNFIGVSGYFIENSGNMKYFEFEHEFDYKERTSLRLDFNFMNNYVDFLNLAEFHNKLKNNGVENTIEPVENENLSNFYRTLSRISLNSNLKYEERPELIIYGLLCIYGVRHNDSGEEEFLIVREDGDSYYINQDRNAVKLFEQLKGIFPVMADRDQFWINGRRMDNEN